MTNEMKYIQPVLARCDNRNVFSPENPLIGGPADWLSELRKLRSDSICTSFDFFVDWSVNPITVSGEFWFKFPISYDGDLSCVEDEVLRHVLRCNSDFVALAKLCKETGHEAKAILFKDTDEYSVDTPIVLFSYDGKNGSSCCKETRIKELKIDIQKLSGGPIRIGAKGLIFGTTRLECYLSKGDALWPGDVDLLVYSRTSKKVHAIFEFKKHTRSARAEFEEQDFFLYYPNPDGRKYDRLLSLANSFNNDVPVFLVFYCNYSENTGLKVQKLEQNNGELGVCDTFYIEKLNNSDDVAKYLSNLIDAVP